jgi:glyoxylase-like metal-dependent hydrolase (beta-lactamase superfamily II)
MHMRRRTVLAGLGASGLASALGFAPAIAQVSLGEKTVTSVSDGNLVLPGDFSFADLPQDELAVVLAEYGLSRDEVRPPCNLTLLQDGERTILFDAGSGPNFMPSAGLILDTLDGVGLSADDITHIVFTHAHPDHLWGVLDDFDDPLFTQAEYLMGQAEWDYWMDPETVNTIGEERASFAVGAARRLEVIEDRMTFFTDGQEVLPGVQAHASFGHTPGHMSFEIRSGGDAILVVGDAIGNGHVAFVHPEWASASDHDPDTGVATRMRLLDMLATDQMQIIGFHLPQGGLGRVERANGAYRFVQED